MREAKAGRKTLNLGTLLIAAVLVAVMASITPLHAATGDDTPANATDLGSWDSNASGQKTGETLGNPNPDRLNYYKFTLTSERLAKIVADE